MQMTMSQQYVALAVCLALVAMNLGGCGSSDDKPSGTTTPSPNGTTTTSPNETTSTATTTITATTTVAAMITKSPYTYPGVENGTLELSWSTKEKNITITVKATVAQPAVGGWLGIGWSPDGKMENAEFVIGYGIDGGHCVQALQNKAVGSVPGGTAGFTLTQSGFEYDGQTTTLAFERPLTGAVPIEAAGNFVLTAAGSDKAAKGLTKDCKSPLALANHHDLRQFVKAKKFGLIAESSEGLVVFT